MRGAQQLRQAHAAWAGSRPGRAQAGRCIGQGFTLPYPYLGAQHGRQRGVLQHRAPEPQRVRIVLLRKTSRWHHRSASAPSFTSLLGTTTYTQCACAQP